MKKYSWIILLIVVSIFAFPYLDYALDDEKEVLELYMGQVKIIPVNNPTRIIIGNPSIADVTAVTKKEITITPRAPGTTTFVLRDNLGENSYQLKVFAEEMSFIKERVDRILAKLNLPGVYTKAEDEENKVFLLGNVETPQDRERIVIALGPLKDRVVDLVQIREEESIVDIDVEVLELDRGATDTLGFTWPGSMTLTEVSSPGLTGATWSTLFRVVKETREAFTLKLDALIQEGKARILSRPRLACQSGKEADLLVGGEKPIFTTTVAATTGTAGTEVEYKEYGIKLKIKPVVTDEERIKIALNVEITELESSTAEYIGTASDTTAKAYPLTKRTTSTELILDDGQTLSIGGLIKQKTSEDLRKFPWLADIPVLGAFFRQRTTTKGGGYSTKSDTELFITLTPKILKDKEEVKEVVKEKEIIKAEPVPAEEEKKISDPVLAYTSIVQKRILERLSYPESAKNSSFQGTVKLSLRLSSQGKLLDTSIKSSSGYKVLDDNAVAVAKGIDLYPPFPPSLKQEEVWIDIPISYRLD